MQKACKISFFSSLVHQLHWSFASAVEVIDAMASDRKDEDQQRRAFVVVVSDANFRRNSNLVAPAGCRICVLQYADLDC